MQDNILLACEEGDLESLQTLLEGQNAPEINTIQNDDGQGLLHIAAINGHYQILRFLIDKGINIEEVDLDGCTSLHYSCYWGHHLCTKILLENNARMDLKNRSGESCFDYILKFNTSHEFIAALFVISGINNNKPLFNFIAENVTDLRVLPQMIIFGMPVPEDAQISENNDVGKALQEVISRKEFLNYQTTLFYTFLEGTHHKLGKESPVRAVDHDVANIIWQKYKETAKEKTTYPKVPSLNLEETRKLVNKYAATQISRAEKALTEIITEEIGLQATPQSQTSSPKAKRLEIKNHIAENDQSFVPI